MKPTAPRLRVLVLAVSAALADCALGQATPSYNSTQAGNATVSSGTNTTVTQTSQRAVLLWNSFSIGQGASVTFNQTQGSSSIAVNRVSAAGGLSTIDGALTANGNVMILNPNGVLFGAHASVNVAGLVASTGDINPAGGFSEFMAGGAFAITGATGGAVSTLAGASITVTGAGLAAFVAPSVSNAGVITATSGRIRLASAEAATISLNGGLYEIAINQGVAHGTTNTVSSTGTLSAAGGTIVLSAYEAANVVSGTINLEGIQVASRIEVNGGQVTLKSDLNAATVAGASGAVTVLAGAQIQDGIDVAASGATVSVGAGTFTQTGTLNVNKGITLAGAGQNVTFIDAHGVHGYGIAVTADSVTLRDFTVFGPAVYDTHLSYYASSYGIKVAPAGGPTSRLHDFHISNVTSRGAGKAELDLNGVVGATIDNVTADGTPYGATSGMTQGAGIQITDSANVEIKNSTTLNNAWGGIALYQSNRAFPDQQTTDITVRSSNHLTETSTAANPLSGPLYLQDESASKDFGTLTLEGFAYAVRNSDSASTNNQYTFLQYTLGGAFDVAANLTAPTQSYIQGWNVSAVNHNFYVGVGHVTGALQAMSIMKAVDTAVAGDTISIAPGNYTETASNRVIPLLKADGTYDLTPYTLGLFVYKDNLTLRGIDSSGNAITSADNVQAWIRPNAITDFGMTIGVTANDVTIEGLGFKPYSGAPINKTIEIQADNFVFRNNVVDNRFQAGPGGTAAGGGGALYFGENDPAGHPINRLTVTGNKFYDGSVVLTNGVGADGTTYSPAVGTTYTPASGRVISGNAFIGSSNYTFGGLLLTGYMNDIGWRKMPVGAATITGNTFRGFDESVLVRGDQQGVDLRQVMASNSFDRAVLVTDSSGNARGELYQSTPDVQHLKYSIESSLQSGVNRSLIGDTISVGAGTYAENVVVNGPRNFVLGGPTVHSMVFNANTGVAGSATADGAGFTFNAPVVLTGNTSLSTTGGNIAFNGDIQNAGATFYALNLVAGAGDIFMTSGGGQSNPLGQLNVLANDFALSGTLWVTGYNLGLSGNIALSDHSLHATASGGVNILSAGGDVTGAAFSVSPLIVNSGGDVVLIMSAPTGSSVRAAKTASVQNVGSGVIDVNGARQVNTQVTSLDNNRIIPPDNALPREDRVPAAPTPGGGGEIQATPAHVGEALDLGWRVEIDLTPGRPKQ